MYPQTILQTSGVILIVLAMVAEKESHIKSEAMLLSLEWRFSRGRFLTPALFDYDKVEVPDGFGGKKKTLMDNPQQAKVVERMYAMLINGSTAGEIAGVLTELQIPTGGRRKYGSLNTNWTSNGVVSLMRNERYCGDVLSRRIHTPNFKEHKSKKNRGKKNKYFQANHHEAIVPCRVWNAAQRILNSRCYGHEGSYRKRLVIIRTNEVKSTKYLRIFGGLRFVCVPINIGTENRDLPRSKHFKIVDLAGFDLALREHINTCGFVVYLDVTGWLDHLVEMMPTGFNSTPRISK